MRIYEINTRLHRRRFEDISLQDLNAIADFGFEAIWLMGVWKISDASRKISRILADDFEGSPFAVPLYEFSPELGGREGYELLRERVNSAGLSVILDFVSNHTSLDTPWIYSNPEWFIRSDCSARPQAVSEYFLHPSGDVVAFGRDPFFPPWVDTAQLDYTSGGLRSHMIDVLTHIAAYADGVRCDMAMLLMRDYIRRQWYPNMPDALFDSRMPGEFWTEAIAQVKSAHPGFLFIAESYWGSQGALLEMGFDYCYEKELYDGLAARDIQVVMDRLSRGPSTLQKSLYFIENHDELRAASVFESEANLAATALILTLPGAALIHEGQMSGKKERLPVQRIVPRSEEEPDRELESGYYALLRITKSEPFITGEFQVWHTEQPGLLTFLRRKDQDVVVYLGMISASGMDLQDMIIDITPAVAAAGVMNLAKVTSLLSGECREVSSQEDRFLIAMESVIRDTRFCLLRISAP